MRRVDRIKWPWPERRLMQDMHGWWFVTVNGTDRLEGPFRSRTAATAATGVSKLSSD